MINRIRDFLYSLKSEKAKRKIQEKAFAAVGKPPEPTLGEKIRLLIAAHFKFAVTTLIAIAAVAIVWYKK